MIVSANDEFLTSAELAKLYKVHDSTIRLWVRTHKLPKPIGVGRNHIWRKDDLVIHNAESKDR
jgi:hypothetical protein